MRKYHLLLSLLLFVIPAKGYAAYDKPYIGEMEEYEARFEDTFIHLARDYNLGFVEMRAANPTVDPWLPGEGTKIILPTRHILPDAPREGIVINLPEMRLYKFDGEETPKSYPIGVGREGLDTPLGETTIVRKTVGPQWRPTPRMRKEDPDLPAVVEPGPENPLGTHALYLGWPTYAIHGTNKPFGIGRRISSGCIRMYPEGIVQLYQNVPVGTPVTVVNQPVKLAWIDDELFIEAHPDIAQSIQMEEEGQLSEPKLTDADMQQIIKAAGKYQDRLHWTTVRKAIKERAGYPISIARRPLTEAKEETTKKTLEEEIKSAQEKARENENAEAKEALAEIYEGGDDAAAEEDTHKLADSNEPKRTLNQ